MSHFVSLVLVNEQTKFIKKLKNCQNLVSLTTLREEILDFFLLPFLL